MPRQWRAFCSTRMTETPLAAISLIFSNTWSWTIGERPADGRQATARSAQSSVLCQRRHLAFASRKELRLLPAPPLDDWELAVLPQTVRTMPPCSGRGPSAGCPPRTARETHSHAVERIPLPCLRAHGRHSSDVVAAVRDRSRPHLEKSEYALTRVDFPAPFGPMIPTSSPCCRVRLTPLRMSTSGMYPPTRSSTAAAARSLDVLPAMLPEVCLDR